MSKKRLEDYEDVTIKEYVDAGTHGHGGIIETPDLSEIIAGFDEKGDEIIVVGVSHTKISIKAPKDLLKKIKRSIDDYKGKPIQEIRNLLIEE